MTFRKSQRTRSASMVGGVLHQWLEVCENLWNQAYDGLYRIKRERERVHSFVLSQESSII